VHAFLIALQLLTRIPVTYSFVADDQQLGRSPLYYPLIGLLIGGLLLLATQLFPTGAIGLQAAVLLTLWVGLTGGLHLDGLADCADAWVGGFGDRERSLRIMKDPASGPLAVVMLLLILLLKWTALVALLEQHQWSPLLFAPLLGRSAILALMLSTPYLRPQGMASKLLDNLPVTTAKQVLAVAGLAGLIGLGWPALLATILPLLWLRHVALSRLGGVTGDVYGAAVELIEASVLVVAAWS